MSTRAERAQIGAEGLMEKCSSGKLIHDMAGCSSGKIGVAPL